MRLEITRKTDLAVRALCSLSEQERVKGSQLAKWAGTSQAFMAQVLAPLVQQGWVDSEPGPTGGYRLVVDVSELSMLEVIEAIEGPTVNGKCVLRAGPCPADQNCALHDAWQPARDALVARLAETTVGSACESSGLLH